MHRRKRFHRIGYGYMFFPRINKNNHFMVRFWPKRVVGEIAYLDRRGNFSWAFKFGFCRPSLSTRAKLNALIRGSKSGSSGRGLC